MARVVPNEVGEARIGIVVSRRLGNAVTRNRIRRVFREACRHLPGVLCGGFDVVLIARRPAKELKMWQVVDSVAQALSAAGVLRRPGGDEGRRGNI